MRFLGLRRLFCTRLVRNVHIWHNCGFWAIAAVFGPIWAIPSHVWTITYPSWGSWGRFDDFSNFELFLKRIKQPLLEKHVKCRTRPVQNLHIWHLRVLGYRCCFWSDLGDSFTCLDDYGPFLGVLGSFCRFFKFRAILGAFLYGRYSKNTKWPKNGQK